MKTFVRQDTTELDYQRFIREIGEYFTVQQMEALAKKELSFELCNEDENVAFQKFVGFLCKNKWGCPSDIKTLRILDVSEDCTELVKVLLSEHLPKELKTLDLLYTKPKMSMYSLLKSLKQGKINVTKSVWLGNIYFSDANIMKDTIELFSSLSGTLKLTNCEIICEEEPELETSLLYNFRTIEIEN